MLKHEKRWRLWAWVGMLLLPLFMLSGCGGGGSPFGTPVTLSSISVTPSNPSSAIGSAPQFTATATYTDGSTQDVTGSATWESSDLGVACSGCMDSSGMPGPPGQFGAAAAGTTTISAIYTDDTGTATGGTTLTVTSNLSTIVGIYNVGVSPMGIAIDAAGNVWVTNGGNNVTKLNGATGAIIGAYPVGGAPWGIAIDAAGNVWTANRSSNSLTELNGVTGATIGTYAVGADPQGIAIDAAGNVWTVNNGSNNVTELSGATGATIGTYAVGIAPFGLAIDAAGNVWVTNGSNNVTKLNGATGATIGTYAVSDPAGIAIDAAGNVWVTNYGSNNVTKLNGATGAIIGTYPVGANPWDVAMDAMGHVWVTNPLSNNITELNGATGATIGTYSAGTISHPIGGTSLFPQGIAINAAGNVWVADTGSYDVTELSGATGPQYFPYNGPQWPGGL